MTPPAKPTEPPLGREDRGDETLDLDGDASRELSPTVSGPKSKVSYVGAPAIFALTSACQDINRAFDGFGCYHVGSSLERPDWRDVDVRFIMSDEAFRAEFPDAGPIDHARWEMDAKWILLTVAISERLSKVTGLPVDFQFQPQSHANARHKGRRSALGLYFAKEQPSDD